MRYKRRKEDETLSVHMDHSTRHDGGKIQGKFDTKDLVCSPHPPYSHHLSACDFCFFGTAKGEMKDRGFYMVQDVHGRLAKHWNGLTFEDVQSVFLEWKIQLNWAIENGGEYYSE
jgi:hypothetical protein